MCASTWLRVAYGFLAGLLFYMAGESLLSAGLSASSLLYGLLGLWLGWIAITGAG